MYTIRYYRYNGCVMCSSSDEKREGGGYTCFVFQMRYQDPIINLTQVKELTTGRTRNQLALADQLVVLRGKQFDRNSHEAMIPVSLMDNQEINSKKYVIRTPWKWQGNEIKSLNDGVIEYTDEEASTINVGG